VSLYASFSEDANGVFSTVAGKIKDSGDDLWSPIYGAGEQIRTLGNSVIARTCGFPFLGKPTKSLENLQQIK
jgi:hypothetical protein